jgi:metal-responsive CopG/Arc/MetJ family transcriptional regulator
MNLTLSVDEQLVERARKVARAMGKSLSELVREYLRNLVGDKDAKRDIEELRALSRRGKGRPGGWRFNREELHERP